MSGFVGVSFRAVDSQNATTEVTPNIYYCPCQMSDQCDYSSIVDDGPVGGSGMDALRLYNNTINLLLSKKTIIDVIAIEFLLLLNNVTVRTIRFLLLYYHFN